MCVVEFFRLFGAVAFLLVCGIGILMQLTYGFSEQEF